MTQPQQMKDGLAAAAKRQAEQREAMRKTSAEIAAKRREESAAKTQDEVSA